MMAKREYVFKHGYIMTQTPGGFDVIAGRVFGGDGSASYQIAARPYDELPVAGHPNREAAYEAAVKVLEERDSHESL